MSRSRPRRIVRRAVMALAVVVLLPVGYFGSVLAIDFAYGAGCVPFWFWNLPATHVYYEPLYAVSRQYPLAAEPLSRAMESAQEMGRSFRRWAS